LYDFFNKILTYFVPNLSSISFLNIEVIKTPNSLHIGDLLIPVPIVQGGMGVGISLSGLASAVADMGGVGVISAAGLGLLYRDNAFSYLETCIYGVKQEIRKAKALTKGILGINIMVAMTNYADMVNTAIEEKIDIIFSGAGLPLDLPKYLTPESKTKIVPIVSSGRAAKLICEKWYNNYKYAPDAIVIEGPKAGGHLGFKPEQIVDNNFTLENILVDVVKQVRAFEKTINKKIPIIAGGGIYTGKDMYDIMQLGADAVQLGTRFVMTHECDASIEFKNTYIKASEKDIEIIQSPVGMPGRAINNEFIEKIKKGLKQPNTCPYHCIKTCDYTNTPYCIFNALFNAYKGNMNSGYAFAGSNAYKSDKIISVKELFDELLDEYSEVAKE
jgi:nitronate monooxygenase